VIGSTVRRTVAAIFFLSVLPADVSAQPIITTEIDSGYLLAESNYLVTQRPVVQTDLYMPTANGLFGDLWYSHQLYTPTRLFGARGDEVDVTAGWDGTIGGEYQLRAAAAWWASAGSNNDFGDAKVTLRRPIGDWAPFIGIEDQLIVPRHKHIGIAHVGTDVVFGFFHMPVEEHLSISWFDGGRITIANILSVRASLGGIAMSPILRVSTDDRQRGTQATVGVRFRL
jgi:hypothetical protein